MEEHKKFMDIIKKFTNYPSQLSIIHFNEIFKMDLDKAAFKSWVSPFIISEVVLDYVRHH